MLNHIKKIATHPRTMTVISVNTLKASDDFKAILVNHLKLNSYGDFRVNQP